MAATLLARHAGDNEAGLIALLVITGGSTAHLAASVIQRRSRGQYDAV